MFKDLPLTISVSAMEEINNILKNKNIPEGYALRVGVNGGGCSGVSFFLGFDTRKPDDNEFEHQGIKVLMSKKHMMFLVGVELDFINTNEERGFVFNN